MVLLYALEHHRYPTTMWQCVGQTTGPTGL